MHEDFIFTLQIKKVNLNETIEKQPLKNFLKSDIHEQRRKTKEKKAPF